MDLLKLCQDTTKLHLEGPNGQIQYDGVVLVTTRAVRYRNGKAGVSMQYTLSIHVPDDRIADTSESLVDFDGTPTVTLIAEKDKGGPEKLPMYVASIQSIDKGNINLLVIPK